MSTASTRVLIACIIIVVVSSFFTIQVFAEGDKSEEASYTFWKKPYIHPRIVEDLTAWVSDTGDQVVAINLHDSQDSNRYYGSIEEGNYSADRPYPSISCNKVRGWCEYQYIGKTDSGIHVLFVSNNTGGTGIFRELLFVTIEEDYGLSFDVNTNTINMNNRRTLVKRLGAIRLGDRYKGKIKLKEDSLFIGKDVGRFKGWPKKDRIIKFDLDR